METREEIITIERKKTIYIANDGAEFDCKETCRNYEKSLAQDELVKKADEFLIEEMEDYLPIGYTPYSEYDSEFHWYKVRSDKDVDLLNKTYDIVLPCQESYPELVCIENYCNYTEIFWYTGTDMIKSIKSFFNTAGYDCVITERNGDE